MSSVIISGDTSGTVTVTVPAVAGTNTVTIPAATGTVMVSGNMPAFSAKGAAVSVATSTNTKLTATTVAFDTNTNFASSRFTPTVAGYYQINATVACGASATGYVQVSIFKNGSSYLSGSAVANSSVGPNLSTSTLISCNGSTDYIEIYSFQTSGGNLNMTITDFSGSLVRAA
jgi:hypothetical protein